MDILITALFAVAGAATVYSALNPVRVLRRWVGALVTIAANMEGLADALQDLGPSWVAGFRQMGAYQRQRASAYLSEARRTQ